MPDIPQEAVDNAVDAWHDAPRNEFGVIPLDDLMRHVLAAAAPVLAAQAREDERRKVAEEIRHLSRWEMQGGYVDLFAFQERHERLAHISTTEASMVLKAVADEIEGKIT